MKNIVHAAGLSLLLSFSAAAHTPQQAPRIASPAWELVGEDAYVHGQIVYPD